MNLLRFIQLLPISIFNGLLIAGFLLVSLTLITANTNILPGFKSFIVLTGSMEPLIPSGSVTFTQKLKFYQPGDIISFKQGDVVVTHRIIGISQNSFKTKGDANNTADSELVAQSQILGKVQSHLPYLGKLIIYLKTPLGLFVTIIIPGVLFILTELWKIKKEIEKITEQKILQRLNNL